MRDERFRKIKQRLASKQLNIQINIVPSGPAFPVGMAPQPVWQGS